MDNKFDLKKFITENKAELFRKVPHDGQEDWDDEAVQRAADHQDKHPEQIKKDVREHEAEEIAFRFTRKYSRVALGKAIVNGHYDGDIEAAFRDLDEYYDYDS